MQSTSRPDRAEVYRMMKEREGLAAQIELLHGEAILDLMEEMDRSGRDGEEEAYRYRDMLVAQKANLDLRIERFRLDHPRPGGRRPDPQVATRNDIIWANRFLSNEEICRKLDFHQVPLPQGWEDLLENAEEFWRWTTAYTTPALRNRVQRKLWEGVRS